MVIFNFLINEDCSEKSLSVPLQHKNINEKPSFMLNTLLFASLAISGVAGVTPDSVVNKDVSLNEVVVTDFKQNKRNLTSVAVSTINH